MERSEHGDERRRIGANLVTVGALVKPVEPSDLPIRLKPFVLIEKVPPTSWPFVVLAEFLAMMTFVGMILVLPPVAATPPPTTPVEEVKLTELPETVLLAMEVVDSVLNSPPPIPSRVELLALAVLPAKVQL